MVGLCTRVMVSGKEGTVSTASRNCRNHVQRLRGWGNYAPQSSGRQGEDPGVLRPLCPTWQSNSSGKPQTPCDLEQCESDPLSENAAFLKLRQRFSEKSDNFSGVGGGRASGQTTLSFSTTRICRLEARTGTSPPLSFHHPPHL